MSLGSVKLVDFTKKALYKRLSPYKCVISNGEHDFVCHAIFVISASEYFGTLYSNAEEKCEIEPGVLVPRYVSRFLSHYQAYTRLSSLTESE